MAGRERKYPPGFVALTAITLLCTLGYVLATALPATAAAALEATLGLSSRLDLPQSLWQPLSYFLIHSSPMHLFFNLAVIYVFGRSMLLGGSGKAILPVFAAGTLAGAAFYVIFYGLLLSRSAILEGASAGAIAMAVAVAVATPRKSIDLLGLARAAAAPLALAVVALSAIGLVGTNFGGALAHLGGLAAGIASGAVMRRRHARAEASRMALQHELDALRRRINISGYESLDADERRRFSDLTSILRK